MYIYSFIDVVVAAFTLYICLCVKYVFVYIIIIFIIKPLVCVDDDVVLFI